MGRWPVRIEGKREGVEDPPPGADGARMGDAPTGTVTFLFTDIEGSTRLWEAAPEAMPRRLARHDELLAAVFDRHGGQVFATGGDGFAVAFGRAADAIDAACEALAALDGEPWPPGAEIRVRMGIHTGEATERDGDYFGGAVNRTARLMAVAHGGQALCSETTLGVVEDPPPTLDLGEHRLRDLFDPGARRTSSGHGRFLRCGPVRRCRRTSRSRPPS